MLNKTKLLLLVTLISGAMNALADNNLDQEKTPQQTAQSKPSESTNYCHDPIKAKEWEGMRLKYPADVGILHLYALRIGLCQAVDDKKIGLETAIDVFNVEHQKLIKERLQQKDPNRQLAI